ncbi:MAG: DUF3800 domain-containing protein [Chloroflexota bacterium]
MSLLNLDEESHPEIPQVNSAPLLVDRVEIRRLEAATRLLEPAIRAAEIAGVNTAPLLMTLQELVDRHQVAIGAPMAPSASRGRPATQRQWTPDDPRPQYGLFVDESGGQRLTIGKDGAYFAVGGLLVSQWEYPDLEDRWLQWKIRWIGRHDASMHSGSLRRRSIRHYAVNGEPDEALASLEELMLSIPATLFIVALDKRAFGTVYQDAVTDEFLPDYHYALCVDMLLERVVHCLLSRDDAHAQVIAESRNRLENAKVQLEYQRLQIEGTALHSDTWFRYQLAPHIRFRDKTDNVAGLQIIDILLRATMEKLNDPASHPLRWSVAERMFYRNEDGEAAGWGLTVFPEDPDGLARVLSAPANEQPECEA